MAIVFAIVGAFYYLRVIKVMYFDAGDRQPERRLRVPHGRSAFACLLSVNSIVLLAARFVLGPADRLVQPGIRRRRLNPDLSRAWVAQKFSAPQRANRANHAAPSEDSVVSNLQ